MLRFPRLYLKRLSRIAGTAFNDMQVEEGVPISSVLILNTSGR